jgi:predicted GH43/DUF377 family glycosyl hydrolase
MHLAQNLRETSTADPPTSSIQIRRHALKFLPDSSRVLMRPFIPGERSRVTQVIGRVLALSEEEAERELEIVRREFGPRHRDLDSLLLAVYRRVERQVFTNRSISKARQLLIGSLFSGEYALESAALFNPSIVPHPDQSALEPGALRFLMSLRATGEGHISSIEFRAGVFSSLGEISAEKVTRFVSPPEIVTNPTYEKASFLVKLHEMGFATDFTDSVLASLGETFTLAELDRGLLRLRRRLTVIRREEQRTLECVRWLAESNYKLRFSPDLAVSERVIFPGSPNESNGIEDARFVRFVDEDGTVLYYATYTAYNGHVILPQLMTTRDFLDFGVRTLNGRAVQNKGMALFPRRIDGHYAMISRQDDENLFIMFSDNPHHWEDPQILARPSENWELSKIGNCGSPIETEAGWLLLTHGVGPMRKYCIGAVLLDLVDPTKVIGRLRAPLLTPDENEREGYVPNVVYTCGALRHGGQLILPYAVSDRLTVIASIGLEELLGALVQ